MRETERHAPDLIHNGNIVARLTGFVAMAKRESSSLFFLCARSL